MSKRVINQNQRVVKRLRYEDLQEHVESILRELDEEEGHLNDENDWEETNHESSSTSIIPGIATSGIIDGISNIEESDAENELIIEEDDIRNDEQQAGAVFEEDFDDEFETEETVTGELQGAFIAKDQTAWCTTFPNQSVRTSSHNIFRSTCVGPTRATKGLIESAIFGLIFTPSMIEQILTDTNNKAEKTFKVWNEQNPTKKERIWNKLTIMEFKAFIGFLLLMGVNKSSDEDVEVLWSKESVCYYRATMPRSRFREIMRFIRFDSERTRAARLAEDKAAPISALWMQMNENLRKYYQPSGEITVDEQLFGYRGRTRFTQYIPSKPAKYGIKIWFACDAKSYYPLNSEIYTGKNADRSRAVNVGENVVTKLVRYWENTGRTIVCDNFFTSLNLGKYLMAKGLALLGTVRQNKTFVPSEMKADRSREEESAIFGFHDNKFALVSYVPKRGRAVILLASTPLTNSVIAEKKSKPQYILDYNANKGGVDTMDKMLSTYSTKRKTLRWPLAMFFNMLDISALASFIIYSENNAHDQRKDKRRIFLRSLANQFIMPAIEQRSSLPHVMGFHQTRLAIEMALGRSLPNTYNESACSLPDISNEKQPKTPVRCHFCDIGNRKTTRKICSWCKKPVCDMHAETYTLGKCCLDANK